MYYAGTALLVLGLLGLTWSTVAAPFMGLALAALTGKRRASAVASASPKPLSLEILVAAHNEEAVITSTLESLVRAAQSLSSAEALSVSVTVGCDHCTDGTKAAVEAFAMQSPIAVRTLVNDSGTRGKWNLLKLLIGQSHTDWVALVDAASIWNERLLVRAACEMRDETVVGVAPSYAPQKSGSLERLNWKLEQFLKGIENRAGGPVAVHGASVLYRRDSLARALEKLAGCEWLNDDVVIPLTLRLDSPERRLVYLTDENSGAWVTDLGVKSELGVEYRRRRRMLIGNLQWVRLILAQRWLESGVVTAIATRRLFRMLWAYWALLIGAGTATLLIAMAAGQDLNLLLICALAASAVFASFVMSNWARRLLMAFVSGLELPRHWIEFSKSRGVVWL